MKNQSTTKLTVLAALIVVCLSACSVQQFPVNTQVKPFQNGGKVWGEKTDKRGKNPWKLTYVKSADLHLFGINILSSNSQKMAEELQATSYTIETKSNLIVYILSGGVLDYKTVKVIKRDK